MNIYIINIRNVLVADFAEKKKATTSFPPLFTDTSTCNAVKKFPLYMNNVIVHSNDVYIYYGLFIPFGTGTLLTKVYPKYLSAIKATVIIDDDFKFCGYTDNSFHFCNTYYYMNIEKQISKFKSANCINVLLCQKYLGILGDLSPIKELLLFVFTLLCPS